MLFYVVTREHAYTMQAYARDWNRLRLVFYDNLFEASSLPVGTYIFTDIDRLTPSERQLATDVWRQLAASSRVRLLNNPQTVLCRYELMRELATAGENQFRARRVAEGFNGLRYPVFIRAERDHNGAMTPLLPSAPALWRSLVAARVKGYRARDLLIVEFCDISDADGLFRKYSAFFVDGEVLPRHLLISQDWHLKKPDIDNAQTALEVESYLEENPHAEMICRIFRRANIDYGRIDYSMLDGQPQVWEINTNPLVKQLARRLTEAFARFDQGQPSAAQSVLIRFDPQLVTNAASERREESRWQKGRERISTFVNSPSLQALAGATRLLRREPRPSAAEHRATVTAHITLPKVEGLQSYDGAMQALSDCLDISDRKDQRRSAQALASLYYGLLRAVSPPLFIEAGARDASVSRRVRTLLPKARIVAFEPSPFNTAHFEEEFDYKANGIEYEHMALADAPGNPRLYMPRSVEGQEVPAKNGLNSLLRRTSDNVIYDETEVRAVTLDGFFHASESEGCCVWIDVEGANGKVLSGGRRLLGQTQMLMIELEERAVWRDQWLRSEVVEFLSAVKLVPVARDFQWWPDNYNMIFVRHDLLGREDIRQAIDQFYIGANNKWRKDKEVPSGRLLKASRKARAVVVRAFGLAN